MNISLALSVCSAPLHPPGLPQAGTARLEARSEAAGDPLAQSCPGLGGAVTADGRAGCQIPEARPAVGVSRGEVVV